MAQTYYLPAATAVSTTLFIPTSGTVSRQWADEVLAVEYLNYGIIGGVQITSLSLAAITITGILINNEFSPSLCAPHEARRRSYLRKGFPRCLSRFGHSFITITDAPAALDRVRSLCYGKPVNEVKIFTTSGDFTFGRG